MATLVVPPANVHHQPGLFIFKVHACSQRCGQSLVDQIPRRSCVGGRQPSTECRSSGVEDPGTPITKWTALGMILVLHATNHRA